MGPRLVGALKDEDGRVISTPEAAAATWERKFLEAFSGMGELRNAVARGDDGQSEEGDVTSGGNDTEPVVSEAGWLPLVSDALATAKQGKAVGPDALPADLLKARGLSLLPHLARLAARAVAAGVPKSWRGGRMALVPKKAALPFTLQNSRRVLCANVAGWVVAKEVRSQLVGPSAAEAGARQHGAVAAVLFTDLASEFYSALPELALGAILSSRKGTHVFDALCIAQEQRTVLEELIKSEDATVKRQEVAACWRRMAAVFHGDPWFWVRARGTRFTPLLAHDRETPWRTWCLLSPSWCSRRAWSTFSRRPG